MPLFNNKLHDKINKLENEIQQKNTSLSRLEEMIDREKMIDMELPSVTELYHRFGDPYIHDVTTRRCIDEIAKNISSVKLEILNRKGDLISQEDKLVRLFNYINDEDTQHDFVYEIVRSLSRYGKAFVYCIGENTVPNILEVLDASKVTPVITNGKLFHWKYKGKLTIQPQDMMFIRYKHPTDPWDGTAPLSSIMKELTLISSSLLYNIKYFQNGATGRGAWVDPSGTPLTPQQKKEADFAVEKEWNKGLAGAHESPVLTRKLEWIRTSDSSKDMDFINLLSTMSDRVMDAFGVPKVILRSSETTFSNLSEGKKMFWSMTLKSIMALIESSITSFFNKRGIDYIIRFRIEDVIELQQDLNTKLDAASKLYAMNVPLSVINEILDLQLGEGWEGWDAPQQTAFQLEEKVDVTKVIQEYDLKKQKDYEKSIVSDAFISDIEYRKSLSVMLSAERDISTAIERFYREKYKLIESFIEMNNKEVKGNDLITRLIAYIKNFDWSGEFFLTIKSTIEKTFNKGRYRTYWGVGAAFNQSSERAVDYIMTRGLKLANAPQVVQDTIIDFISSKDWTIDELAKALSSKWKDTTVARAKLIAITESTAAYNGGRLEGMKELGIKKKKWVHSQDNKVRDSHRIDSVIDVDSDFTLADGYKVAYPGDGDPEHACGCRCTIVSYLD